MCVKGYLQIDEKKRGIEDHDKPEWIRILMYVRFEGNTTHAQIEPLNTIIIPKNT